ncbi:rhomboid family intramembrane serine protease [Clostridium sp. YIM B02555]|uniref:rhomboid family intramembrane serine protease n=1 Tax=Clostridium sp. YIM B02555 TaxID=2911968 RepID=UPI001EEF2A5C|nr:rhomboid family intramembrane serine protease [Clostridium sp. YIM B02555]
MKNIKEEFYKTLLNREDFYMKQYYSNYHKEDVYIAIKELREGIYCALITDEANENIDSLEAFEYIKTLDKPFSLNVMILSGKDYIYTEHIHPINKLIINKDRGNVIACDESCLPLKQIFEKLLEGQLEGDFSKEKFLKYKIITFCIIAINIVLFIVIQTVIHYKTNIEVNNLINAANASSIKVSQNMIDNLINGINNSVLVDFGAKDNILINQGQIWRLFTCAFLHSGFIHIACNMYSLYIIGPQIEQIYGARKYLIIYTVSCVTASLLSYFMNPDSISVGASGAIFGLMGALLAFAFIERNKIQKKYMSSLMQVIIINLFIGLSISNIDNFAHIGGLVGGVLTGYISYKIFNNNMGKL